MTARSTAIIVAAMSAAIAAAVTAADIEIGPRTR
jgi:hypothetical protein